MKRRLRFAALLVLPLMATGCSWLILTGGAAAGAGALVWSHGRLEETIGEPIDRVHRAARSALADFKATLQEDRLEGPSGVLDGSLPDGRRVQLKTKLAGEKATRISIRVGFWGDRDVSLQVLEQLKKHL